MKFLSAFVRIAPSVLPAMLLLALPALVQAQPGSGGPTPGATTAVPIDGGASLLLAAGGAYALRRLRRGKQAK
jgi:hypothetical protein